MARPVCKRLDPGRLSSVYANVSGLWAHGPGQDGDTPVPVLIKLSASSAVFKSRLPERRSTVRPSSIHPPADILWTHQRIFSLIGLTSRCHDHFHRSFGGEPLFSAQQRPGDPRELIGQRHDGDVLVNPGKQSL